MGHLHIFFLIVTATAASATPTQTKAAANDDYRLPEIYNVTNYALELNLPSDSFTDKADVYSGIVTIKFSFLNATDSISLHADHDFIALKTVKFNNYVIQKTDYSLNNITNILNITLTNPITVHTSYLLIIEFEGRLSTTDTYGFYKSSYADKSGTTKYLATTQFEATYARRAFPCFDEPSFKAVFTVSIARPKNLNVLSNAKESRSTTNETTGVTTTIFEDTPRMSTYLLAFIISEFTCTSGDKIDIATYQVCSRNETLDQRTFAVETGPLLLSALNNLTNYKYSTNMKKMDQIAIPDFSAGAMENWGLITYRETDLLWDKADSSNKIKQTVATVIAHEFTHQWFGNLVTCAWWSETFLNEGFATYFQYFIAHEVFPDWELDKQFVIEVLQNVLDVDELENSQALQSNCSTPTEISAKFGDISYSKGGSILRMVALLMGDSNFMAGLRTYLVNNKFTGAKPEQLWAALSTTVDNTVSNLPTALDTIMENWVKKPGFPLVTVSLNGSNIVVSQERFLLSGNDTKTKWYVPITYTTSKDSNKFTSTSPVAWLTPTSNVTIKYPGNSSWIILNNQQAGYYRVNYDDTLWGYIKAALRNKNFDGITEINRAQIVDDVFSLTKINKLSYLEAFDITKFLANDTSYYTWSSATQAYDFLLRRVGQNSKLGKTISAYLLNQMENLYKSVPLTNSNETDQVYTLKQVLAWTWACKLGQEDCVTNAKEAFSQYKTSGKRPDKNFRSIVYCNALRNSDKGEDWDFLWSTYSNSSNLVSERSAILSTLGCTKNVTQLEAYLNKTIKDGSGIRSQDAYAVFSAVFNGNQEGVGVAYDFMTKNYKAIAERYQSMNALSKVIKGVAERFTTEEEVKKLEEFVSTGDLPIEFKSEANEALEIAKSNQKWLQDFEKELMTAFDVSGAANAVASFVAVLLIAVVTMIIAS